MVQALNILIERYVYIMYLCATDITFYVQTYQPQAAQSCVIARLEVLSA